MCFSWPNLYFATGEEQKTDKMDKQSLKKRKYTKNIKRMMTIKLMKWAEWTNKHASTQTLVILFANDFML